jgi:hypothetical protein
VLCTLAQPLSARTSFCSTRRLTHLLSPRAVASCEVGNAQTNADRPPTPTAHSGAGRSQRQRSPGSDPRMPSPDPSLLSPVLGARVLRCAVRGNTALRPEASWRRRAAESSPPARREACAPGRAFPRRHTELHLPSYSDAFHSGSSPFTAAPRLEHAPRAQRRCKGAGAPAASSPRRVWRGT